VIRIGKKSYPTFRNDLCLQRFPDPVHRIRESWKPNRNKNDLHMIRDVAGLIWFEIADLIWFEIKHLKCVEAGLCALCILNSSGRQTGN
jgi:hypothetical protein